jgi:hypothetical protein
MDFVHEHAPQSASEEPKILTVSSRALNRWLIPLVGLGASGLALLVTLLFGFQTSKRTA